MIPIVRTTGAAAQAALGRQDKFHLTETDYALWYFAGVVPAIAPLPPAKKPVFKVYKSAAVVAELEAIFGEKCAYCESVYGHVGPMDVEHYRPKSGYLDEKGGLCKPGYFWLAADWNNLLASCPDCNRERKQVLRIKGGKLVKTKAGKANRFPIADERARATTPAGLAAEVPLLLNPCVDQPSDHLRFRSDGFVDVAETPQEAALPKGRRTIEVCGLERDRLRGQRRALATRLAGAMQYVLGYDRQLALTPGDPFATGQLVSAEAALTVYQGPAEPYQALVKTMLLTFNQVRPVALGYHQALATWQLTEDAADRLNLEARIGEIAALLGWQDLDTALASTLFASVGVSPPT